MKVKPLLTALLLLSLSTPHLYAPFAGHQRINPDNDSELGLTIKLFSPANSPYINLTVVFDQKTPHLVILKKPQKSIPQQGFRDALGIYSPQTQQEGKLELSTRLVRTEPGGEVQLTLHAETMQRAYLCFDFPEPGMVLDGGYYYTVDLPAYLKYYQSSDKSESFLYNSDLASIR